MVNGEAWVSPLSACRVWIAVETQRRKNPAWSSQQKKDYVSEQHDWLNACVYFCLSLVGKKRLSWWRARRGQTSKCQFSKLHGALDSVTISLGGWSFKDILFSVLVEVKCSGDFYRQLQPKITSLRCLKVSECIHTIRCGKGASLHLHRASSGKKNIGLKILTHLPPLPPMTSLHKSLQSWEREWCPLNRGGWWSDGSNLSKFCVILFEVPFKVCKGRAGGKSRYQQKSLPWIIRGSFLHDSLIQLLLLISAFSSPSFISLTYSRRCFM